MKSAVAVTQSPIDVDALGGSAETFVRTRSSLAGGVAEPKSKAAVSAQNVYIWSWWFTNCQPAHISRQVF